MSSPSQGHATRERRARAAERALRKGLCSGLDPGNQAKYSRETLRWFGMRKALGSMGTPPPPWPGEDESWCRQSPSSGPSLWHQPARNVARLLAMLELGAWMTLP